MNNIFVPLSIINQLCGKKNNCRYWFVVHCRQPVGDADQSSLEGIVNIAHQPQILNQHEAYIGFHFVMFMKTNLETIFRKS